MLSEKILVVDDDPRVIKTLKLLLNEYEILSFSRGRDVIDYLSNPNRINLVLLDVMMPEMDGLSVLSEIKRINKNISVIIMTAYGSKDVVLQALRSHADDFIEKPFKVDELKEKIKDLLKEKYNSSATLLTKIEKLNRIKKFIKRNMHNVTLSSISEEICLSTKYISRMFNVEGNPCFRQYKLLIKIDKAKELLKNSMLSVSQISHELGYQNPESFMRIFKRITGKTPMGFRQTVKQKNC